MAFAVFDHEGNLVGVENTVDAAVKYAYEDPRVKDVHLEVDTSVVPSTGRVANAGSKTPIAALRASGLATLPDGIYVTVQGTAAYPLLTALVIGGIATLVGERFLENGKKAITVTVKLGDSKARKANA